MSLPSNLFFIVDIIIVVIFVVCMAVSYHNGLIYELLSLLFIFISIFLAYLISPILAKRFYLIKPDLSELSLINSDGIYRGINVVVWFIVLVIIFCLVFILLKPLFKKFTKFPLVGWVNKLFGVIIGFVKGLFICCVISYCLTLSLFSNGNEIKQGTFIKYSNEISNKVITFVVRNIDYDKLGESIENFDANVTRSAIESFFIKQGFLNE